MTVNDSIKEHKRYEQQYCLLHSLGKNISESKMHGPSYSHSLKSKDTRSSILHRFSGFSTKLMMKGYHQSFRVQEHHF